MKNKVLRFVVLYTGIGLSVFGFHAIERPIVFLVGLGILVGVANEVWFDSI